MIGEKRRQVGALTRAAALRFGANGDTERRRLPPPIGELCALDLNDRFRPTRQWRICR